PPSPHNPSTHSVPTPRSSELAQAGAPPRPLALDDVPPLELEAELLEAPDRRVEVLDDDADVVQGERHRPTLRDRHRRRGVDIATPDGAGRRRYRRAPPVATVAPATGASKSTR